MNVQFARNTPIEDSISMPLSEAQKNVSIAFKSPEKGKLYTTVMRDPDAPNPDYIHFLNVNGRFKKNKIDGEEIIEYYPPQRENHRYIFEIYEQEHEFVTVKMKHEGVDFEKWARKHGLTLIDKIVITTTGKNGSSTGKYCKCELHNHSKNMEKNNGFKTMKCEHGIGKFCDKEYNLATMSLDHLLAFANIEGIKLINPESRNAVARDIQAYLSNK